jgi:hypothetical protein
MSTQVQLPAPPATPEPGTQQQEQHRQTNWFAIWLAVAGVGASMLIAVALVASTTSRTEPVAKSEPAFTQPGTGGHLDEGESVPEPSGPAINWNEVWQLRTSARKHTADAIGAFKVFDLKQSSRELDAAADDFMQVVELTASEPAVSSAFTKVADHWYAAADASRSYRFGAATRELKTSLPLMKVAFRAADTAEAEAGSVV